MVAIMKYTPVTHTPFASPPVTPGWESGVPSRRYSTYSDDNNVADVVNDLKAESVE